MTRTDTPALGEVVAVLEDRIEAACTFGCGDWHVQECEEARALLSRIKPS